MKGMEERLADRCLELCRIPSVTGDEARICDHIESWARALPGTPPITRHGNSLVVGRAESKHRPPAIGEAESEAHALTAKAAGEKSHERSSGEAESKHLSPAIGEAESEAHALTTKEAGETSRPLLALVGHLDTVPPHEGDPTPFREGDKIVGRGSSDMKGGVAVAMALFEELYAASSPYRIILVLYEREEGPHLESGLRTLLAEEPWLKEIDLALVLEPTDGAVQVGCLGTIHATLTFKGKSAHSARPWHGRNAITAAGALLAELHERAPIEVESGGRTFKEVMTVTLAEGGRYRNVVPDSFSLNLNYRFAPGKSVETARREILDLVSGAAKVELTDISPSGPVPAGNAHLGRLLSLTGRPVEPKQAWTDVARLAEAGVDAVNFGPGLAAQAHQAGEYCTVSGLSAVYEDLRRFLRAPAAR